jgi:hypothetical protein
MPPHQNCGLSGIDNTDGGSETNSTHSKDGANDDGVDNNGIYGNEYDDDDGNFGYHSHQMGWMKMMRMTMRF